MSILGTMKCDKTAMRLLVAAIILTMSCGVTLAQELLQAPHTITVKPYTGLSAKRAYTVQQGVDRSGFATIGDQKYVAADEGCACTNLSGVTVICEDCDKEVRSDFCHLHDRACQDTAQRGGIREHNSFFCTTLSE